MGSEESLRTIFASSAKRHYILFHHGGGIFMMGKISKPTTSRVNAAGLLLFVEHIKRQPTGRFPLIPILRVGVPLTKVVKKKRHDYEQNSTD